MPVVTAAVVPQGAASSAPVSWSASCLALAGSPASSAARTTTLRPPTPPLALMNPRASTRPSWKDRQRRAAGPERSPIELISHGGAPGAEPLATRNATGASDEPLPILSDARHTPADGSSTSVRQAPAVRVRSAATGLAAQSQTSDTDTASTGLARRAVNRLRPGSAGDSATRTSPPPTTALAKAGPARTLPFWAGSGWPRPWATPTRVAAKMRTATPTTASVRSSEPTGFERPGPPAGAPTTRRLPLAAPAAVVGGTPPVPRASARPARAPRTSMAATSAHLPSRKRP